MSNKSFKKSVLENIVVTIISTFGSIVIALITAGFFKEWWDKRKETKSRKKLIKQIEKDELIHFTLKEIKNQYHADRVSLIQFHNGGTFYTNSPMQKASMTFERSNDGLERMAPHLQNFFVSHYTAFIKSSIDGNMFFVDLNDMDDVATKALFRMSGTQSVAAVPIYDRLTQFGAPNGNLISLLIVNWVFSEVPSELTSEQDFSTEFKQQLHRDGQSIGNLLI